MNKNILGESPIWNYFDNKFYWVDILDKKIKSYDDKNVKEFHLDKMPTCLALIDGNQIFTSVEDGLGIYDLRNESFNYRCKIDASSVRFNDGKCDRDGNFYIGTMDRLEKSYIGSIYKYYNNYLEKVVSNTGISNGISFSTDNKIMYYSDSLSGNIYSRINSSKNIECKDNIIYSYNGCSPDGSTVDNSDRYYSCLWGGSRIDIFKDFNLESSVNLDVKYPTCCCFGGYDMNKLFVTSASVKDNSGKNGDVVIMNMDFIGVKEISVKI